MSVNAKVTVFTRYKQSSTTFSFYQKPTSLEALQLFDPKKGNPIDRLIKAWLRLLGNAVEVPYVRISDDSVRGDSLPYDHTYVSISNEVVGAGGTIPDGTLKVTQVKTVILDDPDFRNTAVLAQFSANSRQKAHVFMRYIPDSIIDFPIGLNPTPEWDKSFIALVKLMKDDQWCIKCQKDETVNPPKNIKRVFRNAAGDNMSVETTANHNLAIDDKIRIYGVAKSSEAKGIFTVDTVVSPTVVTLRDTVGPNTSVTAKGKLRKREYEYIPITAGAWLRVTGRKAGRPFDAAAGRSKKR